MTEIRAPFARHGRLKHPSAWCAVIKLLAIAVAVALVSGVGIVAITAAQFGSSIESVAILGGGAQAPGIGGIEGGFDVLIVGSDVCEDDSGCDGRGAAELNDVTMILHVSDDQTNAVAISIPRDLIVPIPSCPTDDGGSTSAMSAQPISVTLMYGGLNCTALTVTQLTGLSIDYAVEVKFTGVIAITDAIGGVDVCVDGAIDDKYSGFSVPAAGTYSLSGQQALNFLRTRHGVGNGGDIGRISTQQMYLSSMIRKLTASDGALRNPIGGLTLAKAVRDNTIVSDNLKNPITLFSMAQVATKLDLAKIAFVQYPAIDGTGSQLNKVLPSTREAAALFARIAADEPVIPDTTGLGTSAVPNPGETPAPTALGVPEAVPLDGVTGQTAADATCARSSS